jgi:hypothetical protein
MNDENIWSDAVGINPDINEVKPGFLPNFSPLYDTLYSEGDIVATPNGRGVVMGVITEDFEFPEQTEGEVDSSDEGVIEINASSNTPAYIVGFVEESGAYRASSLEASSLDEDAEVKRTDGDSLAFIEGGIDVDPEDDLPEGWDEQSLMSWWASIGGTWDDCVNELEDEDMGPEPELQCSDFKSMVAGTERWRGRF